MVVVLSGKRAVGVIALRDEPRPDAAAAVARLKDLGVRPLMLTGDGRLAAESIARRLGVEVQPELLPDAKLGAIAALKAAGPTAMIGDGINDAPALACANVGVAMGSGTEVALEVADAALLTNRVAGVVEMVTLSRATLANISAEHRDRARAEGRIPGDHPDRRHVAVDGDPGRYRRHRAGHRQCASAAGIRPMGARRPRQARHRRRLTASSQRKSEAWSRSREAARPCTRSCSPTSP